MARFIEEFYGTSYGSDTIPSHEQAVYDIAKKEFSPHKFKDILQTEAKVIFDITLNNLKTEETIHRLKKAAALGMLALGSQNQEKYDAIINSSNEDISRVQDEIIRLELFREKDIYGSWNLSAFIESYDSEFMEFYGKEIYAQYKLKLAEARKYINYQEHERNAELEFNKIRDNLRRQRRHTINRFNDYQIFSGVEGQIEETKIIDVTRHIKDDYSVEKKLYLFGNNKKDISRLLIELAKAREAEISSEKDLIQIKLERAELKLAILVTKQHLNKIYILEAKDSIQKEDLHQELYLFNQKIKKLQREKKELVLYLYRNKSKKIGLDHNPILEDQILYNIYHARQEEEKNNLEKQSISLEIQDLQDELKISDDITRKALLEHVDNLNKEFSKLNDDFIEDNNMLSQINLSILEKRAELISKKIQNIKVNDNFSTSEKSELVLFLEELRIENGIKQQTIMQSGLKSKEIDSSLLVSVNEPVESILSKIDILDKEMTEMKKEHELVKSEILILRQEDQQFYDKQGPLYSETLDQLIDDRVQSNLNNQIMNEGKEIGSKDILDQGSFLEDCIDIKHEEKRDRIFPQAKPKSFKDSRNEILDQKENISPISSLSEKNTSNLGDRWSVPEEVININKITSRGIRWFRYLLNLWPITVWPLCMTWMSIAVPFQLIPVIMPAVVATFTAICLSYYVPKFIRFVRKRHLVRRAKKLNLDAKTYVKQKEIERNQQYQNKFQKFFRRNWKTIAIILGMTALLGGIGTFLVPAVLVPILTSSTVYGLMGMGGVSLIGGSVSIIVQTVEKFGIVRLEKFFDKKYQQQTNQQNNDSRDSFDNSRYDSNINKAFNDLGNMSINLEKYEKNNEIIKHKRSKLNSITHKVIDQANIQNEKSHNKQENTNKQKKFKKNDKVVGLCLEE